MTDQSGLKRAFADYARTIARPYDIGEVLYRLTEQVADVLDIDGAGVSLADPDGGSSSSPPPTSGSCGRSRPRSTPTTVPATTRSGAVRG